MQKEVAEVRAHLEEMGLARLVAHKRARKLEGEAVAREKRHAEELWQVGVQLRELEGTVAVGEAKYEQLAQEMERVEKEVCTYSLDYPALSLVGWFL